MPIGPLPFVFAGAGAAVGGLVGRARRSGEFSATKEGLERISKYQTHVHFARMQQAEDMSHEAQRAVGSVTTMNRQNMSFMQAIADRVVKGAASDDFTLRQDALRRVEAAEYQKEQLIAEYKNRNGPLIFDMIKGAISGFTTGLDVAGATAATGMALEQFAAASELRSQQESLARDRLDLSDRQYRTAVEQAAYLADLMQRTSGTADAAARAIGMLFKQPNIDPLPRGASEAYRRVMGRGTF